MMSSLPVLLLLRLLLFFFWFISTSHATSMPSPAFTHGLKQFRSAVGGDAAHGESRHKVAGWSDILIYTDP